MKNKFKIISIIVGIIAVPMLVALIYPLIVTYNDPQKLQAFVESLGVWGMGMMFFVQVAQIIVAVIPGEVVEFVAGALYGWLGGLVFCLSGIALGQTLIFKAVRYFGKSFAEKVAGSKGVNKFKFLQNEKKLRALIFILYFVPGTPKDLLSYVVPLTKVKLKDFLVITLFARIPTIVSSTYAGDAFADKDFMMLAIMYTGIAVFSIGGVIVYRLWDMRHEKKKLQKGN